MPSFPIEKHDYFLWFPASVDKVTLGPGVYWIYWSSRKLLKVGMSTVDVSLRIAEHFESHGHTEHVFVRRTEHEFVIRNMEQSLIKQIEDYNISKSIIEWAIVEDLETAKMLMNGRLKRPYSYLSSQYENNELYDLASTYVKEYSKFCNGRASINSEGKTPHNVEEIFNKIRHAINEKSWEAFVHEWNWLWRMLEITQSEYCKSVEEEIKSDLKLDAAQKQIQQLEEKLKGLQDQLNEARHECDQLRSEIGSDKFADIEYLRQRVQDLEEDVRYFRDI